MPDRRGSVYDGFQTKCPYQGDLCSSGCFVKGVITKLQNETKITDDQRLAAITGAIKMAVDGGCLQLEDL